MSEYLLKASFQVLCLENCWSRWSSLPSSAEGFDQKLNQVLFIPLLDLILQEPPKVPLATLKERV
ncbi:hypothetical protein PCANC_13973 [Puccinia coronata f. sp. avenae]|uniref:Uncharacterized protein n=1 Tax=Puccinia coronata f. sp. avenae TaxID=200324 RepID=A0A2N5SL64_9BASI|nr:hypothetical protein PCANC_13973 [Puccinia coronata f. sp. avenae]